MDNERYEQITVTFTKTVRLPRFSMVTGDTWTMPRARIKADGSFDLGAGTVRGDEYEVTSSRWLLTYAAKAARHAAK